MVGRFDGIVFQDRFETNLRFDGNLTVKKDVQGPIEIHYSLTRCGFDRTNCEDFDKIIFKNICEKIRDRTSVFTHADQITPRITCPVKSVGLRKLIFFQFSYVWLFFQGVYSLNNATLNLDIFSRFPISGYRWLSFIKWMKGKSKKQGILCINSDIIITSPRGKTLNNIFKVHSTI